MNSGCGKTLGHGLSCVTGYLCEQCQRIAELEAWAAQFPDDFKKRTAYPFKEQEDETSPEAGAGS